MTIDRISTAGQAQFMLSLVNQAGNAFNTSQQQVASGKVSTEYSGFGSQTSLLEATRTAATKSAAYQANTNFAVNQADLQDTQLSSLSDIANQLRTTLTNAVANNDGSTMSSDIQGIFDQVKQILNSQDANGNYIYGGDKDNTPPVNVSTLAQLVALPSVAAAFSNGTLKKSVAVSDSQNVQVGVLASDAGTALLQTLKDVATFDAGPSGNFAGSTTLTKAQSDFLTSEIPVSVNAATSVNSVAASNGDVYNQLKDAATQQQSLNTLYQGFVSNIENVDLPTALAQESQNQVALQAALQVTSRLGQISLLNYLPAPTTTG
jgi:flagellar hook-associated protein 3 FlgL